jgi:hypothetical protein
MNLKALRDYCGSLLDYDPVNPTYTEELTSFLNDAQGRLLNDRPWDFLVQERAYNVRTDVDLTLGFTNGSASVTGTGFPVGTASLPGSEYELGTMQVTDSAGVVALYQVRYVQGTTQLHIDRPFTGVTGSYAVTLKRRNVYLPADTAQVMAALEDIVGYPQHVSFLSKLDRDSYLLDPDLLGTPESYLEGEAEYVPAPRAVRGVSVRTPGAGQGVRTVTVYQVNVRCPAYPGFDSYPGFSGGFESGLSPGLTFNLTDTQDLQIDPDVIDSSSGLYRRYYFTCTDEGIDAPRRLRDSSGVDTIAPPGLLSPIAVTTSLATLQSQALDTSTPRYQRTQSGAHRAVQFYPHPSSDTRMTVRRLVVPQDMEEQQDTPAVPSAYARIIAYEALTQLAVKADQTAVAAAYERKRQMMYRGMEQRYLGKPSRRIVKNSSGGIYPTIFGPLTFS